MSSNRGFTLIEFLVAIVILMVGLLGLLQMVNVSFNANLKNQLRDEAINVGDIQLSQTLAKGFSAVTSMGTAAVPRIYPNVERQVQMALKSYSVSSTGATFVNSKEINFVVAWRYKGTRFTHNAGGIISNVQP